MTFQIYTDNLQSHSQIEQRAEIINRSFSDISYKSRDYIKNSPLSERIDLTLNFIASDIVEMAKSDFSVLYKIGWFPWVEISNELSDAFSLILIGLHKSSIDCQRRALELAVVASYLSLESVPQERAREWICSKMDTPHFSTAIKDIAKSNFPKTLNESCDWKKEVQEYYWELCNHVHTKGEKYSRRNENSLAGSYNGISVYRYDEAQLLKACTNFITSTGYIAFICALENPVSLFGLPIDEKFGLNPPASGFLQEAQSERLRSILPESLSQNLIKCAELDRNCQAAIDWVLSMPDLSDTEFSSQCNEFNLRYGINNKGT